MTVELMERWRAEKLVEDLLKASHDDFIGYNTREDIERLKAEIINALCCDRELLHKKTPASDRGQV